jgi:hypothetical protein
VAGLVELFPASSSDLVFIGDDPGRSRLFLMIP